MKLTKKYLRSLISESLQEIETNVSGFHQDRKDSDPTPEAMGKTVYVILEDRGIDGSTVYGVFDEKDMATAAGEKLVELGVVEYFSIYSFNLNQVSKSGGVETR